MSCLYILEINPLSAALFANIFFHSEGCLFISFMVFFAVQKFLSLIRSHLLIFVFISITLGGGSKIVLDERQPHQQDEHQEQCDQGARPGHRLHHDAPDGVQVAQGHVLREKVQPAAPGSAGVLRGPGGNHKH